MKAAYKVTFEFDEAPAVMVEGDVEASSIEKMAWRAIKEAREERPGLRWASIVLVMQRDPS